MDEQKPGPIEWSIGGTLGVAAVLTGVVAKKWWLCAVLLGLLLLLVAGYIAWRMWKRHRNEKQFSGEIEQQSSNAGVRKAEQKAQLDQFRRAFMGGIDVYKKRKKDVYSVPWYLMIGTSGSGKTEAIRHSEIGFPRVDRSSGRSRRHHQHELVVYQLWRHSGHGRQNGLPGVWGGSGQRMG